MVDILNYNSIISDIKNNNLKNLYLFYGSEGFLINDALSRLEKKVVNDGFKSLNYVKIDGSNAVYDSIINACETLPFMNDRKLVVVKDCSFFEGKKSIMDEGQLEELGKYFSSIPATTILVFVSGKDVDKRKKIYNALKKNGCIVEFSPLNGQELIKWIIKAFEKSGKTISRGDASYFSEMVPGNLEDVLNEVNKICSYAGDKTNVSRLDIDAVISKSLEMNVFQLIDSISSKRCGNALVILNELLMDGQPIPVILAMIIRQYRLLLNTILLAQKGYSSSEIGDKLSIRPFVVNNLIKLLSGYSLNEIEMKLERCLETDICLKTGKMEQRTALESLIVEFAK